MVSVFLRQFLKTFLPQSWRSFLWLFKENHKFLRNSNRTHAITTALAVALKDSIYVPRMLDYQKGEIIMDASSRMQLVRLDSCRKEPETVNWIESHIKPGDIFYDIGANVGAYSFVALAAAGGKCSVYAFEPGFYNFASLSHNIFLNHSEYKIIAFQCALTEKTCIQNFHYSDIRAGHASHKLGESSREKADNLYNSANHSDNFVQSIIGYSLDDFISQFKISLPNHMKIDVDGAEFNVLAGARKTLLRPALRSILIEIDESQPSSKEVFNILKSAGFRIIEKHKRGGRLMNIANYIFER